MKQLFHIKTAVACLLVMFIAASLLITGCGGGGTGTSGYSGGYPDNTTTTTCTVSGVCKEKDGTTVIPAASVSITDSGVIKGKDARGFSFSTVADGSGVYYLNNVPPGTYVITVTATGHVTQVYQGVSVTGDMTKNLNVISTSDWNAVMGDAAHPYDSTKGYIQVNTVSIDSANKVTPVSDVVVSCTPTTGIQVGYMSTGVVNWTATSTGSDGQAFIYGGTPGSTYTLSAKRDFMTFNTINAAAVTAGAVTVYELSSINEGATLNSITVTPASAVLPSGAVKKFTAIGQYSNGQTQDITEKCNWSTSDTTIGTVSNTAGDKGTLTAGGTTGTINVKATFGSVSGQTAVTVKVASITKIILSPSPTAYAAVVAPQNTFQFRASAEWSDNTIPTSDITSKVAWATKNGTAGTIDATGKFMAVSEGAVTVYATYSGITSGDTVVTVGQKLVTAISITPTSKTVPYGYVQEFLAAATYSDGTSGDVTTICTWKSSDLAVGGFTNNDMPNQFVTAGKGSCTVTASIFDIKSQAASVTVLELLSLTVDPKASEQGTNTNTQYSAWAVYSGTTEKYDVTRRVNWTAVGTCEHGKAVCTINTNGYGVMQCIGKADITATLGATTANATLTVRWGQADRLKFIEELGTGSDPQVGVCSDLYNVEYYKDGGLISTVGASWTDNDNIIYGIRTRAKESEIWVPVWKTQAVEFSTMASSITFINTIGQVNDIYAPDGLDTVSTVPRIAFQYLGDVRYGFLNWIDNKDVIESVGVGAGFNPSIATDPKDKKHYAIAYELNSNIYYAYDGNAPDTSTKVQGSVVSLAFDILGIPSFSCELGALPTNKQLFFAKQTGSTWPVVTMENTSGYRSSLACNPITRHPAVAYESTDGSNRVIKYQEYDGSQWVTPVYPATNGGLAAGRNFVDYGMTPCLEFTTDGRASISYATNNGTVRYAYFMDPSLDTNVNPNYTTPQWRINDCPFGTIDGWPSTEGVSEGPNHKMGKLSYFQDKFGPYAAYVKSGQIVAQKRISEPNVPLDPSGNQ
jgi:hypothetical protein